MKIKNLCIIFCVLIAQCVFAQIPSEQPVDPLDPSGPSIPVEPSIPEEFDFPDGIISIELPPCDCPGEPKDFTFNFSSNFGSAFETALANDRAAILAARQGAIEWYNRQTSILNDRIEGKLRKDFPNYPEARTAYFRHTENQFIDKSRSIYTSEAQNKWRALGNENSKMKKGLKLLKQREAELKAGNIDNSLYRELKYGNQTIGSLRNISAVRNEISKAISKIVEFSWKHGELGKVLTKLVENNAITPQIKNAAFQKKYDYHRGLDIYNKASYIQFLLHYDEYIRLIGGPRIIPPGLNALFLKFGDKVQMGNTDFIIDQISKAIDERLDPFHPNHWEIILYEKYNGGYWNINRAKADHKALLDRLFDNILANTPLGSNFSVDFLVDKFSITNIDQFNFLNDDPNKAKELENLYKLAAADLDGGQSTRTGIRVEIVSGGNLFSIVRKLDITNAYQKRWLKANPHIVSRFSTMLAFNDGPNTVNPLRAEVVRGGRIQKLIEDLKIEDTEQKRLLYDNESDALRIVDLFSGNIVPAEFIKQSIANGSIKYVAENYEASLKSPTDIDLSDILDKINSPQTADDRYVAQKFLCIYNKILKSPNYKKLFVNLFQDSKRFNVKFKIVEGIRSITPGKEPNGLAQIRDRKKDSNGNLLKTNVTILINKKILNTGTSQTGSVLDIAKTIIHESIHGYISIKMLDCKLGLTLNNLNNKEFETLINEYHDGTCGTQEQHEFMFDFMIPNMVQILNDIRDDLIIERHRDAVSEPLYIPGINGPIPFSWNDFFYNISLAGVDRTESFIEEIKNNTRNNLIHQGYRRLSSKLSKECN
ncbi:hypothetical protein [Tenacibaculum agarivorans]|uniref:hypothetical protein n=1 Tax=Tenacibaculum agarivorans TaxID=1908389 RepID=UPI00094BA524|nr:hypothetical protein [Tenacibaculum agarivorans]